MKQIRFKKWLILAVLTAAGCGGPVAKDGKILEIVEGPAEGEEVIVTDSDLPGPAVEEEKNPESFGGIQTLPAPSAPVYGYRPVNPFLGSGFYLGEPSVEMVSPKPNEMGVENLSNIIFEIEGPVAPFTAANFLLYDQDEPAQKLDVPSIGANATLVGVHLQNFLLWNKDYCIIVDLKDLSGKPIIPKDSEAGLYCFSTRTAVTEISPGLTGKVPTSTKIRMQFGRGIDLTSVKHDSFWITECDGHRVDYNKNGTVDYSVTLPPSANNLYDTVEFTPKGSAWKAGTCYRIHAGGGGMTDTDGTPVREETYEFTTL